MCFFSCVTPEDTDKAAVVMEGCLEIVAAKFGENDCKEGVSGRHFHVTSLVLAELLRKVHILFTLVNHFSDFSFLFIKNESQNHVVCVSAVGNKNGC